MSLSNFEAGFDTFSDNAVVVVTHNGSFRSVLQEIETSFASLGLSTSEAESISTIHIASSDLTGPSIAEDVFGAMVPVPPLGMALETGSFRTWSALQAATPIAPAARVRAHRIHRQASDKLLPCASGGGARVEHCRLLPMYLELANSPLSINVTENVHTHDSSGFEFAHWRQWLEDGSAKGDSTGAADSPMYPPPRSHKTVIGDSARLTNASFRFKNMLGVLTGNQVLARLHHTLDADNSLTLRSTGPNEIDGMRPSWTPFTVDFLMSVTRICTSVALERLEAAKIV
ncbi:hypothetical protein NMY22_g9412 [Coprinellus aureogranulatus]|nr:hypothetical protein NMY22_g9412 [Coprinellus aureogranulatus]